MNKKIYILIKSLAFVGIILAMYLLWQQFFRPQFQPCTINATMNCDAIISGEVAKTFGLPTPLYGLLGYIVIFFSSLYRWKKVLLGVTTFGLLFCLWIAYRELFELGVICPICILCQIIMFTIFSLAVVINKHSSQKY